MASDNPQYSDVINKKGAFHSWERTYEYRGIKYNIVSLHRFPTRWFVVEVPKESREIANLVSEIRYGFLYTVCDGDEAWNVLFYEAVNYAKKDIDWFFDESVDEVNSIIETMKDISSKINDIQTTIQTGDKS